MRRISRLARALGLGSPALFACNSLTGIYSLPEERSAQSGDGGSEALAGQLDQGAGGGEPRTSGGADANGGGRSADGGNGSGGREAFGASGGQAELGGSGNPTGGARAGGADSGGTQSGGTQGGGADSGGTGPGMGGASSSGGGSGGTPSLGLPLLDDFSMPLDTTRWVRLLDFSSSSGQLTCPQCFEALLWSQTYGLPQAASMKLSAFIEETDELNIVLLAASSSCDLIEASYSPFQGEIRIISCDSTNDWLIREQRKFAVSQGSVLEGQVYPAATPGEVAVEVWVDGSEVLESTFAFPLVQGRIGVSGICNVTDCGIRLDDFRGGTLE